MIPVLLYHSVSDAPPAHGRWGAVSSGEFARQAEVFAEAGPTTIGVTALAEGLRGERPLPERPAAVTFDDGYADTVAAVEHLLERGIVSTVYVTSGAIDIPGHVSSSDIAHLANLPGVELGAHGVNHRHLDELSSQELALEIVASKSRIEDIAGVEVLSFAYPHGAYDRHVRADVIAAGYRSAAAVKNAISHRGDDPFAIARWSVDAATTARRVAEVLDGKHVPLAWPGERLRTRAYRTGRRLLKARSAR